MLNVIHDYLLLGAEPSGDPSTWPLALAVILMAVMLLQRQSDD